MVGAEGYLAREVRGLIIPYMFNKTHFIRFIELILYDGLNPHVLFYGGCRGIRTPNVYPVGTGLQPVAEPPSLQDTHMWWLRLESNQRRRAFQALALPPELHSRGRRCAT